MTILAWPFPQHMPLVLHHLFKHSLLFPNQSVPKDSAAFTALGLAFSGFSRHVSWHGGSPFAACDGKKGMEKLRPLGSEQLEETPSPLVKADSNGPTAVSSP